METLFFSVKDLLRKWPRRHVSQPAENYQKICSESYHERRFSSLVLDNENNYIIGIWLVSSLYSFIYIKFVKYVEP